MDPESAYKHLGEMSPVKSKGAAAGEWSLIKPLEIIHPCPRNLYLTMEGIGLVLTEGLESDVVGGHLKLQISLRVVGTTMLRQEKS